MPSKGHSVDKFDFIHALWLFIMSSLDFNLAKFRSPNLGKLLISQQASLPQHHTTASSTANPFYNQLDIQEQAVVSATHHTYQHGITYPRTSDARNTAPFRILPHSTKLPNIVSKTVRSSSSTSTKTSGCIQRRVSSVLFVIPQFRAAGAGNHNANLEPKSSPISSGSLN